MLKMDKRNAVSSSEYSLSPLTDDPYSQAGLRVEARPVASETIPAESTWWLYMVRMADGRLYTGISTDVARRFTQHSRGKGARALRGKGPLTLVWQQKANSHSEALRLEYRLKCWRKARKEALITRAEVFAQLLAELNV